MVFISPHARTHTHTGGPEIPVKVRDGNVTTAVRAQSVSHLWAVAENWENAVKISDGVNWSTGVKNWLSDSALQLWVATDRDTVNIILLVVGHINEQNHDRRHHIKEQNHVCDI